MSLKTTVALIGAFAASALAHGTVTGFSADGVDSPGYALENYYKKQNGQEVPSLAAWSAENLDNGFVGPADYGKVDINCHKKAAPGTNKATVKAGGKVSFTWSTWPDSHFGPVFTYVAKCAGDCSSADPASLKWVKIDEGGYDESKKEWAATALIKAGNKWETTVPSDLASGSYVFRHEIIAMHGAGDTNGAQNYPQCFNIDITGGGSAEPEGTLGTALYTADHPGIKFNPYGTITNYQIPGPALYGKGSSGGGSGSSPQPTTAPVATAPAGGNGTAPAVPTGIKTSIVLPTGTAGSGAGSTPAPTKPATGGSGSGSGNAASGTVVAPPTATKPGCAKKRAARRHARALTL